MTVLEVVFEALPMLRKGPVLAGRSGDGVGGDTATAVVSVAQAEAAAAVIGASSREVRISIPKGPVRIASPQVDTYYDIIRLQASHQGQQSFNEPGTWLHEGKRFAL